MNTRLRSFLVGTATALTALGLSSIGCAIGTDNPSGDDDDSVGGSGGGNNECGMDCSAIQTDACNQGVCDPVTGNCAVVPAANGTACDDSLFCTAIDTCNEGFCVGAGVTDCELQVTPCQEVLCNEAAKTCTTVPKTEGATCQPSDLCQINGTCTGGTCTGEPRNCLYAPVPSDCHVAECNPTNGQCEARIGNEGGECADPAAPCQVLGTCSAGTCENTSLKDCSAETDPATCTLGVCNTTTGNCEGQAGADDDPCDDLDGCTTGDACQSGTCTPTGSITACTNGDDCCPTVCNISNDDDCPPYGTFCDWPIDVSSVTFPHSVSGTFGEDPATGSTCDTTPTNAVWYSYQASTTGNHLINLDNGTTTIAYSRVGVFDGTGCSPLGTEVDCASNTSTNPIDITVPMTSGQWYLILFHTDGNSWTMDDPTITITPQ